jgi:hypothetical protein
MHRVRIQMFNLFNLKIAMVIQAHMNSSNIQPFFISQVKALI